MSKSNFPALLKRSAFIAHDPVITRVYAATPRSEKIGDWGLKSPVHRHKGAKYIRVGELDSAMGVGATWSSAEKEARFMSMWGDGSIPWDTPSKHVSRASMSMDFGYAEELPEPAAVKQMLPNVESMTEAAFQRYLTHVRKNRDQLREELYAEGGRAADAPADQATLTHAATKGNTRETDSADFQNKLISSEFVKPGSQRLQGRPHRLHGLAYSSPPSNSAALDPARAHKGRALDRASNSYFGFGKRGSYRDGTNAKWVVGMGGLTVSAASGTNRIADKASLSQFDYQRRRPEAGIAYFGVQDATIKAPPRVIAIEEKERGHRYLENKSRGSQSAPLRSFRFDIDVREMPSPETAAPIGSAEWVARENNRPAGTVTESELGILGNRRANRVRGAGAAAANRMSAKMASDNIDNLLAKLQNMKK